jgi:hypothetical protein
MVSSVKNKLKSIGNGKQRLQPISKIHLTPNYCVASLFKILTYYRVCCVFLYVTHDASGVSRLGLERDLYFLDGLYETDFKIFYLHDNFGTIIALRPIRFEYNGYNRSVKDCQVDARSCPICILGWTHIGYEQKKSRKYKVQRDFSLA